MRFHSSTVDKILQLCDSFGGHRNEKKLRQHFIDMRLSPLRINDKVELVDTESIVKRKLQLGQETGDVVPTKFHENVINKLVNMYDMYGGLNHQTKFKRELSMLELTLYERRTVGDVITVLTSEYKQILNSAGITVTPGTA